ncbi:GTP pyrophosphokinase YjbM [compost metagenome]
MRKPDDLALEYQRIVGDAERLQLALSQQLERLLESEVVTLGMPLEGRVKSLSSILEKIKRKSKEIKDILEFDDIVGIRMVLLFSKDLEQVKRLVENRLDIISSEDTAQRLAEGQFGYQSQHYIVRLPKSWLEIPTFAGLGHIKVELQIRTLAQHIWAAASHKLQYKNESSVPPPLRRAIHRVSALLEMVDLEFDRVLSERKDYVTEEPHLSNVEQSLNVDVIEAVLSEVFPKQNRGANETYAELLENLLYLEVDNVEKLRNILTRHRNAAAESDKENVKRVAQKGEYLGTSRERNSRGVFFTHVGLARECLEREFGANRLGEAMQKTYSPEP